ncbi:SAM-dependent methyltransferase [Bacillus pakistanensis]|uniref:SAM-dependent methyltransferase n=1 Tax=Rossellomorea pakistanensis TaxID=992288 RepID=A0ABS2NJF8_9BACI|nr:SAM-dependent methyltransferase [Bacillus pakistanensis]
MDRIEFIREAEKKYHDECYENHTLFEPGSWLHKPVKTVIDLIPLLEGKENPRVLDLGSGVGRNSIPIARAIKSRNGKVICVDLLDSALYKLKEYSKEYRVEETISIEKADLGYYEIRPDEYDLIVAVSSLEHVHSEQKFTSVVNQMAAGTKKNGMNCLIVNSSIEEIDLETNKKLEALMEVNIPTEEMMMKLKTIYSGWEELNVFEKALEYEITRDRKPILMKTNAITYVVKKSRGR